MELDAFDFSITDPLHEHLALDFANTTPYHFDLSEDHLNDYPDLLSWSLNVNLLTEDEVQRLLERASSQPEAAEAVLDGAVRLREAIFNIFSSLTRDEKPDAEDLETFHATLSEAMTHMQLVQEADGFQWGWLHTDDHLDQMLWPVAWSTAQLLRSDERKLVKQCEGDDCQWLFLDTSRNHSRRWCDMKTCGNRAKARRYYRRSKDTT